ncbi:MAG: hypothetical protein LBP39_03325, partial [Rickettsiales bacterium]|nr:hypothetical protein [Rickettsiales bacterium]
MIITYYYPAIKEAAMKYKRIANIFIINLFILLSFSFLMNGVAYREDPTSEHRLVKGIFKTDHKQSILGFRSKQIEKKMHEDEEENKNKIKKENKKKIEEENKNRKKKEYIGKIEEKSRKNIDMDLKFVKKTPRDGVSQSVPANDKKNDIIEKRKEDDIDKKSEHSTNTNTIEEEERDEDMEIYEHKATRGSSENNLRQLESNKPATNTEESEDDLEKPEYFVKAERKTKLDGSSNDAREEDREEDREEEEPWERTTTRGLSEDNLRKLESNKPVAAAEEEDKNGYEESHKKNTTKGNKEYIPTRKKVIEDEEEDSIDIEPD